MNNKPTHHNIDQSEIQKFTEMASRWWDSEGEMAMLHTINPLRTDYIDLHSPVAGLKVLDVGCGGGLLCESLAELGAEVTGIDVADVSLNVARLHLHESGNHVEYLHITAEELAKKRPAGYDVVTCLEMLEHVPDPASIIHACSNLVKPQGYVYFATINRNPKSWLMAIVAAEYILNLIPKGGHEYNKLIKPSELDAWIRSAGLHMEHIIGLHYNPLMKTVKLAPGVDVNYMIRSVKPA